MATANLYDLIDPQNPDAVEREVISSLSAIDDGFDVERFSHLYRDVVLVFHGLYPGYRPSDAWYHDLEHTNTVLLCTADMLVGAYHEGIVISSRGKLLAMACALFHDIGLIRRIEETEGTGARYTVGHENRSIGFMENYFAGHGFSGEDVRDARDIIYCTMLGKRLDEIPFRNDEIRTLGRVVGSADVIAQMADRAYLEKLLLLYREFREAKIPDYGSELELLGKTPEFYRNVVRRRLEQEFGGADAFLDTHARVRWGVEEDPFHRSIERNLRYLHRILDTDKVHYRDWLRRRGITRRLAPAAQEAQQR